LHFTRQRGLLTQHFQQVSYVLNIAFRDPKFWAPRLLSIKVLRGRQSKRSEQLDAFRLSEALETRLVRGRPEFAEGETMNTVQEAKMLGFATYMPAVLPRSVDSYNETYELNRHRVYALAFWMTDNELDAAQLMSHAFCRAFAKADTPTAEEIDRCLISELREYMPLGTLTLNCAPCERVLSVRRNTLRMDLERAVVQLPPTEKMIFLMHDVESHDHARIARTLGLSDEESRLGLHQARLRMREILAK
jgi:RNA polymerase sigma-70 factor (ECF subfamily)